MDHSNIKQECCLLDHI